MEHRILVASHYLIMGACFGQCLASRKNGLRHSTDEQEIRLVDNDEHEDKLIFRIMKFKRKKKCHQQFIEKFWKHPDLNYSKLNQSSTNDISNGSNGIQMQSLDAQTLMMAIRDGTANPQAVATSSRTSSSLDLEWEHEYGQDNRALNRSWLFLSSVEGPDDGDCTTTACDDDKQSVNSVGNPLIDFNRIQTKPFTKSVKNQMNYARTPSRTSWSHISTPESLEWDIDEDQQKQMHLEDDNLDHDTLELLHQIELLKNKVLNETGDVLISDQKRHSHSDS